MKTNNKLLLSISLATLLFLLIISDCKDSNSETIIDINIPNQTVNLRTTGNYFVLVGVEITNNPTTFIIGNIGLNPVATIKGKLLALIAAASLRC